MPPDESILAGRQFGHVFEELSGERRFSIDN
jgi:hypothetical protein